MSIGTVCNEDLPSIQAAMQGSDAVDVSESVTATVTIAAGVARKRGAVAQCDLVSTGDGNTIQFAYGSGPTVIGGPIPLDNGDKFSVKASDLMPYMGPDGEDFKVIVTIAAGGVDGSILPVYVFQRGVA